MSKRNSPCTNYHKPSDDWRLNETKPCEYCEEPMIPAPTTKKHLWQKKRFCSSYCSASARSPYASKVFGPPMVLLALGFLLTAPGDVVAQERERAEAARVEEAKDKDKDKEKTKEKSKNKTTKEKTKYSYNPRESYEDTRTNDDECSIDYPPSSVPEPSNPGVLLTVAGAVLLSRRARKP